MTSQTIELRSLLAASGIDAPGPILGTAQDGTFTHVVVALPNAVVTISSRGGEFTANAVKTNLSEVRRIHVNARGSWMLEDREDRLVRCVWGLAQAHSGPWALPQTGAPDILCPFTGNWLSGLDPREWHMCSNLLPGGKTFYHWRRPSETSGPLTVWQEKLGGKQGPKLLHRWDYPATKFVVDSVHPHFPSAMASNPETGFKYWLTSNMYIAFQPKEEVWCWERLTPEPDGYAVRNSNALLHSVFTDAWGFIIKIFLIEGSVHIERAPRPRGKWLSLWGAGPTGSYNKTDL